MMERIIFQSLVKEYINSLTDKKKRDRVGGWSNIWILKKNELEFY